MTIDEFIERLEKTPRDWYLVGGMIRRKRPAGCQCPWSEVFHGKESTLDDRLKAAIWSAADNRPGHNDALRDRMFSACGLAAN